MKRFGALVVCAARYWSNDNASTTGAALAFYCAFSLAPLLVILLTIAGGVVGENKAYGEIQGQVQWLFGPSTAHTIMGAVQAARQTRGIISTVGSAVTLAIGASTVFSALQTSLNQIWQSASIVPHGVRGFVRSRLLSFGFILALGFLLLLSLSISTAVATVRGDVARDHAALIGALALLDFVASLAITGGLFAVIYRYMPARRVPWRPVIAGGVFTAVLFDIGRWGIGVYLSHSTQASAFGAAASFAALLLWLYYTAQIFLFGAEFTAVLAEVRQEEGKDKEGKPHAPRPAPAPAPARDGGGARRPARSVTRRP